MKKVTKSWGTITESGGPGPAQSMPAADWAPSAARLLSCAVIAIGVLLLILACPWLLTGAAEAHPGQAIQIVSGNLGFSGLLAAGVGFVLYTFAWAGYRLGGK